MAPARFSFVTAVAAVASILALSFQARADVTSPFPGVTLVTHPDEAMTIADLCWSGVSVRATRWSERQATPGQWAESIGAQVAINADFFDFPGWSYVLVRARGAGEDWPPEAQLVEQPSAYWQFGRGFADIAPDSLVPPGPAPRVSEVVGAYDTLILGGQPVDQSTSPFMMELHRRSAIGMSADRHVLYFYASNAITNGPWMAGSMMAMAAEAGAPPIDIATNQDGGGSSQLYVQGYGQIIDSGRQVIDHLGIYASGQGPAVSCPSYRDAAVNFSVGGGYSLNGYGDLIPFGFAPPLQSSSTWDWDIARSLALRSDGQSGYVLDGWGGLHPFGGAPDPSTPPPYWEGQDIARSVAVRHDGASGYVLDAWGAVHSFGGAPEAPSSYVVDGQDRARDFALKRDDASGYVLDADGVLHPFGDAPEIAGPTDVVPGIAVSVALAHDETSGYVIDAFGNIHPFGKAVPIGKLTTVWASMKAVALFPDASSGISLDFILGPRVFGPGPAARRMSLFPDGGAWLMDAFGSITPLEGAPDPAVPPGWPDWDIARDMVALPGKTGGYVLEGWGGIHPFGDAPPPPAGPYWQGQDLARAFAIRSNGSSGYLLDAHGAVAPLGDAPPVDAGIAATDQDIGRDLVMAGDDGGYVLDSQGAIHPFGSATSVAFDVLSDTENLGRAMVLRSDEKSGYVLDREGGVHPFGGAPDVYVSATFPGWDVARDIVLENDERGYVVDVYHQLRPFGTDPADVAGSNGQGSSGSSAADAAALISAFDDGPVEGSCACSTERTARGRSSSFAGLLVGLALALSTRRARRARPRVWNG